MGREVIRHLHCCGCQQEVKARLTDGKEIYSHRPDLHKLPFWRCDTCGNFVGCHYKTANRTKPLGCIPTPELKNARREIHKILDPLWKKGLVNRSKLYGKLSFELGYEYHTAELRTLEEARKVYRIIKRYSREWLLRSMR